MLRIIAPLAAALIGTAASFASETTLVHNVAVVDVERGELLLERDVLVRGEQIERIERTGVIDRPESANVIDGGGLYLMPGLFDAHVHITAGQGTFEPLLLAHGVTAVRDTGAPTDMIVQMRNAAATGETLSPELFITGAIVDGTPPIWPFSEACDTPEQARDAVERLAEAGVDQIKVYSMLKPEVYAAAVDEAKKRGLTVTGHVPIAVPLRDAIEAGQNCIEHMDGFGPLLLELAPQRREEDEIARSRGGIFAAYRGWFHYDEIDRDALRGVLRAMADAKLMQCPTFAVWDGIQQAANDQGKSDERMKYVPQSLRAFWDRPGYGAFGQMIGEVLPAKRKLLSEMHNHSVPLMIGTDLGNPYVFAGWSVHDEMSTFQAAGIPAADVLRMATIEPAKFCGAGDRLGTIEAGKTASMILVRKNPLDDVTHAREIEALFLRGQFFDRHALDELFEQAEAAASGGAEVVGDDVPLELPGHIVHRGRITMKFQEWDAGTEQFLISRNVDGWHAAAHVRPTGGWGEPSHSTLHVDDEGNFLRATWTQLTDPPMRASYTIEDGRLHARAQQGDDEPKMHTIDLPDDFIVSPSAYVADMLTLPLLGLGNGETREMTMIGVGFMSWQPQTFNVRYERLDDRTMTLRSENDDEREIPVQVYRVESEIPMMGMMESTLLIDEDGILRHVRTEMPMGTITAEYAESAAE